MTGRTHDLIGFTALTAFVLYQPLQEMSLATGIVAFSANFAGALSPDLDEPTASAWKKIRGGSTFGKLLAPILGSHRMISHSLLGTLLVGYLLKLLLEAMSGVLLVDMTIVWWAFMIGYISHLISDAVTKEGIPLFFPIPINIGIPPFSSLRIKSGGLIEKSIIFPGFIIFEGYLIYANYEKVLEFFTEYVKR